MRPSDSQRRVSAIVLFSVATLIAGLTFREFAANHIVNADEGFYLAAGRDVAHGLRPYTDFFYPQMPYLPYAEAALFSVSGVSLHAARWLSVLPASLLAGVLAVATLRRTGHTVLALVVPLAYSWHALSVNYLTVLKTYGCSNLFFLAALLFVTSRHAGVRHAAAGGACAAVAVGLRLPMAAGAVLLLLWTLRCGGVRPALAFAAGAALAFLPVLLIAAPDPQAFWFGNIGFHQLRREIVGIGPILGQKLGILLKWSIFPQNFVLWCLAIAGWWRGSPREACAILCAAALGAVYLYATPTYLEYMVQLVPLLLLAAIPAGVWLLERRRLAVAVVAVYLVGGALALRPATAGSKRAVKRELWKLEAVETVAGYLREHSHPDDHILSWWEGYPVLAGRPGFREVGFWHSNVAKKLPEDLRKRYHVAASNDVLRIIEQRLPRLIVCAEGVWSNLRPAIDAGYDRVETLGRVEVFARREAGLRGGGSGRSSSDG